MRTQSYLFIGTLFLLIFPQISPGQNGFQAGYYINLEKDTVRGWVKSTSGINNYQQCLFKSNPKSETQTLKPVDIQEYGIQNQRIFQTKEIELYSRKEEVFLELIVRGKVNLYQYKELFFLEAKEELKQIYIREELVNKNQTQYKKKTTEHIGILVKAFDGCPTLQEEISSGSKPIVARLRFLQKLVIAYHRCIEAEYEVYKKLPWNKFSYGILAGMERSSFSFTNISQFDPLHGFSFDPVYDVGIGISLEYASPRVSQRLSLRVDPYFSSSLLQGTRVLQSDVRITRDDFLIQFREFSIPIGIKYLVAPNWKSLYLGTGVTPQFYSSQSYKHLREEEIVESQTVLYDEMLNGQLSQNQLGIWIETGILVLKNDLFGISLNLRYQHSGNIVPSTFVLDPLNFYARNQQTSFLLSTGIHF